MRGMKRLCIGLAAVMLPACVTVPRHVGHGDSAYAGQQSREIKALSSEEISAYLSGMGMGLARAAELNGYPGPLHSLEHAAALDLAPQQRERLQSLMRRHQDEARALGAEVVRMERELDALFTAKTATPALVDAKLAEIAAAQARLRGSHLKTHLEATSILSADQVARYQRLRGYASGS